MLNVKNVYGYKKFRQFSKKKTVSFYVSRVLNCELWTDYINMSVTIYRPHSMECPLPSLPRRGR